MSGYISKQDENVLHDMGNFGCDEIHFYPSTKIDWHLFFVTFLQMAKSANFVLFEKFAPVGSIHSSPLEKFTSDIDTDKIASNLCVLIEEKKYGGKNGFIPQQVLSIHFHKNSGKQLFTYSVAVNFSDDNKSGYISSSIMEPSMSVKSIKKVSPVLLELSKIIWACLPDKNIARSFPDFYLIGHENLQGKTDNWSFQQVEGLAPKDLMKDIAYRWAVFLSDTVIDKIGGKIISNAPYWKIEKIPGGLLLQNSLHPAELIESNYKTTKYDVMEYYEKVFKGAN